ncbi:MAG TPA: hypothetical protein VH458_02030 [Vicinamibacterales bacterium]|jgi:hypothetical protein
MPRDLVDDPPVTQGWSAAHLVDTGAGGAPPRADAGAEQREDAGRADPAELQP